MKAVRSRLFLVSGVSLASVLMAGAASAQTSETTLAAAPDASRPESGLEDIVVTARRKEERLQSVPVAVTALSGTDLEKRSVTTVADLRQFAPGLSIAPSSFGANIPSFTIRSQLQLEPLLAQDPSVNVYFADILQARAQGLNAALFDLASVQVLKGPQGTLFGRNSTGGAVLITPQAPTDRFEGYGSLTLGNYRQRIYEAAVNIPAAEGVDVRLAGNLSRHKGYTLNVTYGDRVDDQHTDSFRGSLRLAPVERLTNTTVFSYFGANENGSGFGLRAYNPVAISSVAVYGSTAPTLPALFQAELDRRAKDFHSVANDVEPGSTRIKTYGVANTTEFEISPELTLKNVYGYRSVNSRAAFDYDGTSIKVPDAAGTPVFLFRSQEALKEHQNSDELQLLGKSFDKKLDWIIGAYILDERGLDVQTSYILRVGRSYVGDIINRSYAAFAQGTFQFGSGISAVGGIRYTRDVRKLTSRSFNFSPATLCRINSGPPLSTPANPCTRSVSANFEKPTWTVGLNWQIDASKLLYVTSRRGYRSGGFNFRARTPAEFRPYEPETVTDVEVGFKGDWRIGSTSLRTNIAAYHQDYKNIQRSATRLIDGNLVSTVVNAASATVKGVEAEVTWLPVRNFEIGGSYAFSKNRYGSFLDNGIDRSANVFALAPRTTLAGHATLTAPLDEAGEAILISGDVYHQSTIQYTDLNEPQGTQRPYTLTNARLTWTHVRGSGLDLAAYVKNIFDKDYYTGGVTSFVSTGFTTGIAGAPRTFGFQGTYRL